MAAREPTASLRRTDLTGPSHKGSPFETSDGGNVDLTPTRGGHRAGRAYPSVGDQQCSVTACAPVRVAGVSQLPPRRSMVESAHVAWPEPDQHADGIRRV